MQNAIWQFKTKRFAVILDCDLETDPDFSWDETGEARRKCEAGIWDCVCFRVRVLLDGEEIAADYLGNSIYADVRDFAREHRDPDPMNRNCTLMRAKHGANVQICTYFPAMVSETIAEARRVIRSRIETAPRLRNAA